MNDLVTWLRARLDEDENGIRLACTYSAEAFAQGHADAWNARRAAGQAGENTFEIWASVGALKPHYTGITADVMTNMAPYLEAFDPHRMLAEVDAKRRILELHHPDSPLENWYWSQRACAECGKRWHRWIPNRLPTDIGPEVGCPTLQLLALPYADEPGYREEWRP